MPAVCPQCGRVLTPGAGACPWDGAACAEVSPSDIALVGQRVGSRYDLLRVLGTGGMGSVFLARRDPDGDEVVVKFLRADLARDDRSVQRFLRECDVVAALSHPHVVGVFDTGRGPDARPFLVMERLQGRTLAAELEAKGPLPARRAVRLAAQVLDVLSAAHGRGILHRDIKPANLFLVTGMEDDFLKVLDFGVATLAGETARLTRTDLVCGTAAYMSPEQLEGRPLDGRADLYAVGVVLFEALTGRLPWPDRNPVVQAAAKRRKPPALRGAAPAVDFPIALDRALACLLDPRADRRPAGAGAARALLLGAIGEGEGGRPGLPPSAGRLAWLSHGIGRLLRR